MLKFKVDFIYPYGRQFLFYTDKNWELGICTLDEKAIKIIGKEEIVIPVQAIVSIDKRVNLPPISEGRAVILIEFIDIRKKENIYVLISGAEKDIRMFKKNLLILLTKDIGIVYFTKGQWERGFMIPEGDGIVFSGRTKKVIKAESIIKYERRRRSMGFNTVSTIYIQYREGEEKNDLEIITPPLKRDFFWQLLNLIMEEHLLSSVVSKLTRTEKMVLMLINQGATVNEILMKHHLTPTEFKEISDKLEDMGLISKIIILRTTDRGKYVVGHITENI